MTLLIVKGCFLNRGYTHEPEARADFGEAITRQNNCRCKSNIDVEYPIAILISVEIRGSPV